MAVPMKVVFDPESLLIDPLPGVRISLGAMARELRLDARQLTADLGGQLSQLWGAFTRAAGDDGPLLEEMYERFRQHYFSEGRYQAQLRGDAMSLRALMRKHVHFEWVYLSHNGPRETWALIEAYQLRDAIDTVICADEMLCPGLRGELLSFYARELRWQPDNTRVLSDCPPEIEAARQLQLPTLALGYARHAQPQRLSALALNIAGSPPEVLRWLQGQRPQPVLPMASFPWPLPATARVH